jgi:hypothetical protein
MAIILALDFPNSENVHVFKARRTIPRRPCYLRGNLHFQGLLHPVRVTDGAVSDNLPSHANR